MSDDLNIRIQQWNRKRPRADGKRVAQERWTLNFDCPDTGKRRRLSFKSRAAAESHRDALIAEVAGERYFNRNANPTVAEVVEHWLDVKRPNVKAQTIRGYLPLLKIITGPLLQGTPKERVTFALTGEKPSRDAKLLKMLGDCKVSELTTMQLRHWHMQVREEVGAHSANRCMSILKSVLALAQEDFGVKLCPAPSNLPKRKSKPKKDILEPEEVAKLLALCRDDKERGIYVAFPFLTGVRVSEQLGLLWDDINIDRCILTIRRVQNRDGTTTDQTKTEAGTRQIPINETLRAMLVEWKVRCPRLDGEHYRVFPSLGVQQSWPLPRKGGGGVLLYSNYLHRFWQPAFKKSGVRYVTHHSARHSFVSTLQAQGVEVGLVAKLAGHSNPAVTLGHYTQAVRGGADAVAALDRAYGG
jgi:integrase